MSDRRRRRTVVAALCAGAVPALLHRMRTEFERDGRLSRPTATAMYLGYAAHGVELAVAARRRTAPIVLGVVGLEQQLLYR